jgi:hypothetical protein
VEWVAVFVQDNGQPVQGQPTDLASAALEFDTSGPNVCATGAPPPFGVLPIEHGNFDVYDAS